MFLTLQGSYDLRGLQVSAARYSEYAGKDMLDTERCTSSTSVARSPGIFLLGDVFEVPTGNKRNSSGDYERCSYSHKHWIIGHCLEKFKRAN